MKRKDSPNPKSAKAAGKKQAAKPAKAKAKAKVAPRKSPKAKPKKTKRNTVKCPFCGTHAVLPIEQPVVEERVMLAGAAALEGFAAAPAQDTRGRIRGIIRGYGLVNPVTNSTNVGQSVPSMQRFTGDVNAEFGKNYNDTQLQAAWSVNQTAVFVDSH